MLPLLFWVPPAASFVLGLVHLFTAECGDALKAAVWVVFALGLYLEFLSPYSLLGLILQAALAMSLAIWWRLETMT